MKKIDLQNERGAITIIVITMVLFMFSFILSMYILTANKAKVEKESTKQIVEEYNNINMADDIYYEHYATIADKIPIYNIDQLLLMGSDALIQINGTMYNFRTNSNHILMADITFDAADYQQVLGNGEDWKPIQENSTFTGDFDWNGHEIRYTALNDFVSTIDEDGTKYYVADNFNKITTETIEMIDSNNDVFTLPTDFKISRITNEQKVAEGLVVIDSNNNEFVWIPVESENNGQAMAELQTVYTYTNYPTGYYRGKLYTFPNGISTYQTTYNIGTAANREPSLLTNSVSDYYIQSTITGTEYDGNSENYLDTLEFTTKEEFGEFMLTNYQNMIASVNQYQGFYVGRYESSISNGIVKSQSGQTPIKSYTWYEMYFYQDSNICTDNSYNTSASVTSSMIWGSQWDKMLNWMLETPSNVDRISGNTQYVGHNLYYSYRTGTGPVAFVSNDDKINNIYDLEGNVREATQEAVGINTRVCRGGRYNSTTNASVNARTTAEPTTRDEGNGSRMALFIKL